jgi:hypothetical protein
LDCLLGLEPALRHRRLNISLLQVAAADAAAPELLLLLSIGMAPAVAAVQGNIELQLDFLLLPEFLIQ